MIHSRINELCDEGIIRLRSNRLKFLKPQWLKSTSVIEIDWQSLEMAVKKNARKSLVEFSILAAAER